ncbi:MAG: thiamine pyrophosphate-dependent enzyme [Dehalococcoidia bacterium]|nr:thiamine pyrophosphate-dependent enzyme [Dehalococcoidia bacterium]
MVLSLKEQSGQKELFSSGHRLCSGCAESIIVRQVLRAAGEPLVVANATGCLEVATSIYPYNAWQVSWIHSAFENAASTISGVETAYRSLVKQGKIKDVGMKFIAFGGDGATYDIGLQFLSGALERGHKFLYVCLNNEAYMNTGIQRSGSTPRGTWTTTTPVGEAMVGKKEYPKDMTAIVAAHGIPFVAQAIPSNWRDLMGKVQKAMAADGPAFINVLSSCNRGWRHETSQTINVSRLALDTLVWPIYEIDHGVWKLSYKPKKRKPLTDWLASQGRFAHLLRPENRELVEQLQAKIDKNWEILLARCGETA